MFDKQQDVNNWYKGLNRQLQTQQIGPKTVAESALDVYNSYKGKALSGIPIYSVINLLKNDRSKISALIKKELSGFWFESRGVGTQIAIISAPLNSLKSEVAL